MNVDAFIGRSDRLKLVEASSTSRRCAVCRELGPDHVVRLPIRQNRTDVAFELHFDAHGRCFDQVQRSGDVLAFRRVVRLVLENTVAAPRAQKRRRG